MDELARTWQPSRGWGELVRGSADAIAADPCDTAAWSQLAMVFGDTRAAPLALVVCLHARTLGGDQRGVRAHLDLCLLELGLGNASAQPIPLVAFGQPGTVAPAPDALADWVAEHLAPFAGDTARAAQHALAIAVARLVA